MQRPPNVRNRFAFLASNASEQENTLVLEDQNHKELLSLQTDKAYLCWQFTCFDKIAGSFSLQGPNEKGREWGLIVLRPPNVQTKSDLNKYFSALNV